MRFLLLLGLTLAGCRHDAPQTPVYGRCSMVMENALWTARFYDAEMQQWASYEGTPSSHPCWSKMWSH